MGDKYYCHVLLRLINNEHTRSVCFFLRSPRLFSERVSESETRGNIHLLRLLVFVLSLSLSEKSREIVVFYALFFFLVSIPNNFFALLMNILMIFHPHNKLTAKIPNAPIFTSKSLFLHVSVLYTRGGPKTNRQTRNRPAKTKSFNVENMESFIRISRSNDLKCKLGLDTSIKNKHPTNSTPDFWFTTPLANPPMVKMWCTIASNSNVTMQYKQSYMKYDNDTAMQYVCAGVFFVPTLSNIVESMESKDS